MARLKQWTGTWSRREIAEANLFEQALFQVRRRVAEAGEAVGIEQNAIEAVAETPSAYMATALAPSTTSSATTVVLKRTRVRLPTLREEFDVSKIIDTATDAPITRATTLNGAMVDSAARIAEDRKAQIRRDRQIHPALAAVLARSRPSDRHRVMVWIYVPEELFDKGAPSREMRRIGPLIASTEATAVPPPDRQLERRERLREPERPQAQGPVPGPQEDPRATAYRRHVRAAVEQAARELPAATGVRVASQLETVPSLVVEATAAQVRALSARPEVAGLFLYEPEGIDDLSDSMKIARATPVVDGGLTGSNIRVAVWEQGPDVVTDLRIEDFYDSAQSATSDHARLTTAIIKNRESGARHGYAPDCKIYSANSYDVKALHWAVVTKRCQVVNQSFHRASEETSGTMSSDDLIKDYLATHAPFPTIVHAAGNQSPSASTEFVNHKGYNTVVVGNHDDTARLMRPSSVFRNPTSAHQDRELPDLCANGDSITAVGVTMSGTSFASPAVAGTVALLQRAAATLQAWPEGCRAILLASAGRNVKGRTWWDDVSHKTDGRDGAGALDTREGVRIARARAARNGAAARRGWDVGSLYSSDFDANRRSRFKYQVVLPAGDKPQHVRVGLAWSSKITYETDAAASPPIKNVVSTLTVDLDLQVYDGTTLVAWSSSFDSSYEVVDFQGNPGKTYDIVVRRWSGTDWVWFGVAWTVF